MGELKEWIKYWRKTISKCSKIHKDSSAHKRAFHELADYLTNIEQSAGSQELDAAVLWAVKFMQRIHELEKEIGLPVLEKKVHTPQADSPVKEKLPRERALRLVNEKCDTERIGKTEAFKRVADELYHDRTKWKRVKRAYAGH